MSLQLKKILLVYNKPLYQQHILEGRDPRYRDLLKKKHPTTQKWIGVYEQHQRTLDGVLTTLQLLGIPTDTLYRKKLKKTPGYDLVVTVGGDGTILETSHFLNREILLGINAAPSDSTGALCGARLDTFLGVMIDLLTGKKQAKLLPRLKVKVGQITVEQPVLNEALFANRSPAGTSRYLIQVGKRQEEHKSSGVWISTGAGSTAAISSAGGKPLPLDFSGMQFWVREPLETPGIHYQIRSGLLSKEEKILFFPTTRQSAVFIDGNHVEVPVAYGEKVEISPKGPPLKMVL